MAYIRTYWVDRSVEKPFTYTKKDNEDGSYTVTAAPGEVYRVGTPQSATNFNNLEDGILYLSAAFDEAYVTMQAKIREMADQITELQEQVAALTTA